MAEKDRMMLMLTGGTFGRLTAKPAVWYRIGLTETITVRLRRPKSELLKKSGGNLNRWINGLIEQALDLPGPGWDAHFRRSRRCFRYTADEVRSAGR